MDRSEGTHEQQEISKPRTVCEVCKSEGAKYTCPRCSLHTCSLPCVLKHKEDRGCNGKRDKAAFVAKDQFKEVNLRSDLHFLEEMKREVQQSMYDGRKMDPRQDFSVRIKALLSHARTRGVFIEFMPRGMSRHEQNTTIYHIESKTIHWRVEWKFPEENITFLDKRLCDTHIIQDSIDSHLKDYREQVSALTDGEADPLKPYTEEGGRHYRVLFKVHGKAKFCLLDKAQSLQENFARKRVVEFPTLYVVTEDCAHKYPTLTADEEEQNVKARRAAQMYRGSWARGRGRGWGRGQRRQGRRGRGGGGGGGGGGEC